MLARSRTPVLALSLAAIVAGGCVVEEKPRNPRASPAIALPAGPIASPAIDADTRQSRVRASVRAAGTVPYDGLTLPLPSPDGRFIATQSSPAPGWPEILAEESANPAGTRPAVYEVTGERAERVNWPAPVPAGLMLGRSADDEGFLVESIRPNGERWIGRVAWLSGEVEWLARGGVCAHGVLGPGGELAFTRRSVGSGEAVLVLRDRDGRESIHEPAPGESCAFPLWGPSSEAVCTLVLGREGLDIVAIAIDDGKLGTERARGRLAARASVSGAHQVIAGSPGALPARAQHRDAEIDPRPIVFHPAFGRMAAFSPRDGSFELLPAGSVSACHAPGGFVASTPDGLVYAPVAEGGESGSAATLLDGAHLPRAIQGSEYGWILFSPARGTALGDRLAVVFLGIDGSAPPP